MSSLELCFTTGMGWSARLRAKRARTSSCARLKEMRERAEKIKTQATILSQAWGTDGLVFGSRATKLVPVNVPDNT